MRHLSLFCLSPCGARTSVNQETNGQADAEKKVLSLKKILLKTLPRSPLKNLKNTAAAIINANVNTISISLSVLSLSISFFFFCLL